MAQEGKRAAGNPLRRPGQRPLVIGHRGAPGSFGIPASREGRRAAPQPEADRYAPENTLASFERALALGAQIVELDVQLSADGQVVVIHDDRVDRTTDGSGEVTAMTLAQLRALDAGAWFGPAFAGERIPTLDEVLAWAVGRVRVAIELKRARRPQPGLERKVVESLERHGMLEQAVVISFDHVSVTRAGQANPRVTTGVLYACRPVDPVALAREAQADVLLPHWSYLEPEDLAVAHQAGLAVAPWVTSDPQVLRHLLTLGVDAIGTNHPDAVASG